MGKSLMDDAIGRRTRHGRVMRYMVGVWQPGMAILETNGVASRLPDPLRPKNPEYPAISCVFSKDSDSEEKELNADGTRIRRMVRMERLSIRIIRTIRINPC